MTGAFDPSASSSGAAPNHNGTAGRDAVLPIKQGSGRIQNILSVDVEDWFHILEVDSAPPMSQWDTLPPRVEINFHRMLEEFDRHNVRVTCFFLGWVAEKFPGLVKEAFNRGHEIASHGYAHELIYTQNRAHFRTDIRRAKDALEQITGEKVRGYRAPGFSLTGETLWALDELLESGHEYDSSMFPALRGHGGIPEGRREPHLAFVSTGEIVEFPISVTNLYARRICFFGGGYLRLFPYGLIRRMADSLSREGLPVVYYIHPREIDPLHPRLRMPFYRRFKTYVNLSTTMEKLRHIMREEQVGSFRDWLLERKGMSAEAVPRVVYERPRT